MTNVIKSTRSNPETEQARNDEKFKDDPYYRGSGADRNQDWGYNHGQSSNDRDMNKDKSTSRASEENDAYSTVGDDVGNPQVNQGPRRKSR